ncbi:MAG TPA: hypothetical protein VLE23_16865 [Geminicoccaceae bacterium]|nr:hypothetical protein [Geminicoccaceae bacterium]
MPWLIALGPIPALAQGALVDAIVGDRLKPPFTSLDTCLEFVKGGSAEAAAPPAGRLICDRLDRVWQDPTGAKTAGDNPLRIDFGAPPLGAQAETAQGAVGGALLARILAIPQLLPPRLSGGLVLENLIVTGTLELADIAVDLPVALRRARFRPADTILLEDHFAPIAIRLDGVDFAHALEIRESDIAGHLLIDDSTFGGGLTLADVVISSRATSGSPRASSYLGDTPALRVRHSIFEADLSLANVLIFNPLSRRGWAGRSATFHDVTVTPGLELRELYAEGDFQIGKSELGTVTLQGFQLKGSFFFEHNSMTRLEIADGDFHDAPYINQNRVLQSVAIHRIGIRLGSEEYVPEIAVNQIGGSFMLAPAVLNDNVSRLDLTYNRVDGLASIVPPKESTAEIDLSNAEMPTRLELGKSYWSLPCSEKRKLYNPDDSEDPCETEEAEGGSVNLTNASLNNTTEDSEDPCEAAEEDEGRLINLTNASIDILAWNFPIDCKVRWDGAGLSYAYWGDPDLKGAEAGRTDEDFIESLKRWRFAMQEPNSEALGFMSTYLHSRGRFSDSRDLQEEAKEVNYRPPQLLDLGWVVYALLWPTGFGVKPELALFWLFIGWLVGGAVYAIYRWRAGNAGWPPLAPPGLREAPASYVASADEGRITPATLEITEQPSMVAGFMQYQRDRRPADFSVWAFSADAVLPVINLHAYTEYYPRNRAVRAFSFVQHIVGWWMLSIFLASATIL